jgi:hypothetical protein
VTAAGAWERFVADIAAAFRPGNVARPGETGARVIDAYAENAEKRLANASPDFRQRWEALGGAGWRGLRISPHERLFGHAPGRHTGLTLSQHLDQWIELRNALAHQQVQHHASVAREAKRWHHLHRAHDRKDPYDVGGGDERRRLLWNSDADSDTVQNGAARIAVALFIQVMDFLISDIATRQNWPSETLRLPEEWFGRRLPDRYRGINTDELHHQTLWGGMALHRHPV